MLAVSPDGTLITYVANNQLYLRAVSELEARPVPGTGTPQTPSPFSPVFSPDSRWIAFYSLAERAIRKVSVNGGQVVTICRAQPASNGRISWDGDAILFGQTAGVMRVSANGGEPEVLVKVKEGESVHGPQLLPGGGWVLFTLGGGPSSEAWNKALVVAQSLETAERKTIINGGSDGRYLPSGHLVYAVGSVLFAVPFDMKALAVAGDRVPVVEGVQRARTGLPAATQFSVSETGSLVFVSGSASGSSNQMAFFGRDGKTAPLNLSPAVYTYPRLSPEGSESP